MFFLALLLAGTQMMFVRRQHPLRNPAATTTRTTTIVYSSAGGGSDCVGGCGLNPAGQKKTMLPPLPNAAGYFPKPGFRVMHTGEGSLSVVSPSDDDTTAVNNHSDKEAPSYHCQFAQFGPRIPFAGRAVFAVPPEAHTPLAPLTKQEEEGEEEEATIAVVTRGLCSFEAKMRAAVAAGAKGVVLINRDADETFLAVRDVQPPPPPTTPAPRPEPSDGREEEEIPFVVVPSSAEKALIDGVRVSVEPYNKDVVTCWGEWSNQSSSSSVGGVGDVLPLFPVVTEPLLPGAELLIRLGNREREELELAAKKNPGRPIEVAVAFCTDPDTNSMAEVACVASANLLNRISITLKGLRPCGLKTLLRDSTKASFGLALATTTATTVMDHQESSTMATDDREDAVVVMAAAVNNVKEKMLEAGLVACHRASAEGFCGIDNVEAMETEINNLPRDPTDFSFAACRLLGLPPRQLQAALACSTAQRLRGVTRILERLVEDRNRPKEEGEEDRYGSTGRPGGSFVSKAVSKALPSVVRVEPGGGAKGEKAAGFIVGSDGLIVTNRHVVSVGGGSAPPPLVTLQNGVAVPAEVIAVSESYDIAFLKAQESSKKEFPVASLGEGDAVQLGDWVIAMGSPAEFDNLVSLGIASTIQRPKQPGGGRKKVLLLDRRATFIGTDALFNKGISGGPLLNESGDVVGMCTYLREDLNGLGFAIAINRVVDAAHELLGRDL